MNKKFCFFKKTLAHTRVRMEGRLFTQWEKSFSMDTKDDIENFCDSVVLEPNVANERITRWLRDNNHECPDDVHWVGLKQRKRRRLLLKDKSGSLHFVAITKPLPFVGIWNPNFEERIPYPLNDDRLFPASIGRAFTMAFPHGLLQMWMSNYLEPEELWQASGVCKKWRAIALRRETWVRWRTPLNTCTGLFVTEYDISTRDIYRAFTCRLKHNFMFHHIYQFIEASIDKKYLSTLYSFYALWYDSFHGELRELNQGKLRTIGEFQLHTKYIKTYGRIITGRIDIKLSNARRFMRNRHISDFSHMAIKGVRVVLGLEYDVKTRK